MDMFATSRPETLGVSTTIRQTTGESKVIKKKINLALLISKKSEPKHVGLLKTDVTESCCKYRVVPPTYTLYIATDCTDFSKCSIKPT